MLLSYVFLFLSALLPLFVIAKLACARIRTNTMITTGLLRTHQDVYLKGTKIDNMNYLLCLNRRAQPKFLLFLLIVKVLFQTHNIKKSMTHISTAARSRFLMSSPSALHHFLRRDVISRLIRLRCTARSSEGKLYDTVHFRQDFMKVISHT